jgi:basic membrane protein A and related proteins
LVLPGPITDGTFNSAAYKGIKKAEKRFNLKISVQENTSMAKIEASLRSFAKSG